MVKRLLFFICFISSFTFGQRLELGIGLQGNLNALGSDAEFTSGVLDNVGDTIFFRFTKSKMDMSLSLPVFLRYRTKFGLWMELGVSTEKMTTNITGTSNYGDDLINDFAQDEMEFAFNSYDGPLSQQEFYDTYFDLFRAAEINNWEEQIGYTEVTKFNQVSFNLGYTLLRTKKIRPFVNLGFTWNSRVHQNHYQEMEYKTDWVDDYTSIYRRMPRLNSNIFFLSGGVGIEAYNLQLGVNFRTTVGYVQEYEFPESNEIKTTTTGQDLYKNITSFGFYVKYSLFNFNLRNSEDRKKIKDEEFKVMGKFKEKSKIVRLAAAIDIPFYTNIENHFTKSLSYQDTIYMNPEETMFFTENVFLLNERVQPQVDEFGDFSEKELYTYIGLGRIKKINQIPRIRLSMEIEPVKYFSYQLDIGYQFNEFDTEAKVYEIGFGQDGSFDREQMYPTVLRQTAHFISIGNKLNVKFPVTSELYIGINGGVNINFQAIGEFKFKDPGYNASPLIESFHEYYVNDNKGSGSNYEQSGWMNEMTPEEIDAVRAIGNYSLSSFEYFDSNGDLNYVNPSQKMTSFESLTWLSWTAGVDFYYDRLKFTPYVEQRIGDINFLYQDYFSVGLGFTYYLRK